MKITLFPKTKLGKWSLGSILNFFAFLGLFFLFVEFGESGGDTFFSNPQLTIPILIAGLSGITSLFTGLISMLIKKERSVFVLLASAIGLFVLIFILGEIVTPH